MLKDNQFARGLRRQQTPQEKRLWFLIKDRQLGCKFRRQVEIDNYIVDFCCFEKRLIIELDGSPHKNSVIKANDIARTKYLEFQGFTVLRFWNSELEHERKVINKIKKYLNTPHLSRQGGTSSPARGEEKRK